MNAAVGTSSFTWNPSTGLDFLTWVLGQHCPHQQTWVKVPIRNWASHSPPLCLLPLPLSPWWALTDSDVSALSSLGASLVAPRVALQPQRDRRGWQQKASSLEYPSSHTYLCLTSSVLDKDGFILLMLRVVTVFNEETFQGIFWTCGSRDKNNKHHKTTF